MLAVKLAEELGEEKEHELAEQLVKAKVSKLVKE